MALTKAQLFNANQIKAAEFAKAIAHPARIAILEILSRTNACYCGDITEELPLAQSTISQHLKALKKAGIIKGEVEGVKTCYCFDEENLPEFKTIMESLIQTISIPNSKCC